MYEFNINHCADICLTIYIIYPEKNTDNLWHVIQLYVMRHGLRK